MTPDKRQSADNVVEVRALRNGFGEQIVHDKLDLDVRRGEILGVVGGSGTGKSVLMRSIIGLQQPMAGEISVFGQPMIGRDDDEVLRHQVTGAHGNPPFPTGLAGVNGR